MELDLPRVVYRTREMTSRKRPSFTRIVTLACHTTYARIRRTNVPQLTTSGLMLPFLKHTVPNWAYLRLSQFIKKTHLPQQSTTYGLLPPGSASNSHNPSRKHTSVGVGGRLEVGGRGKRKGGWGEAEIIQNAIWLMCIIIIYCVKLCT